jgi:hypothetical protein
MAIFRRFASHDDQANGAACDGVALAAAGFILANEALAAAQAGAVPTAIAVIFDLLPA